jgi:hypothetical protein
MISILGFQSASDCNADNPAADASSDLDSDADHRDFAGHRPVSRHCRNLVCVVALFLG